MNKITLCALPLLLLAAPAFAEEANTLEAGPTDDQLALDLTTVPVGMGAIFVPSLTVPALEPRVVVLRNDARVASGRTGTRLIVPPGTYDVVVGHGVMEQRARVKIVVAADTTVVAPPFFGGLRVHVTDKSGRSKKTEYRLRDVNGLAHAVTDSAKDAAYNDTDTWLLPPGVYTLDLGEGRQLAVSLHGGELLRYQVTVDGGAVTRSAFVERFEEPAPRLFTFTWVGGGSLGFNQSIGQASAANLASLEFGGFSKAALRFEAAGHLAEATVVLDENWFALADGAGNEIFPLQKLNDEVSAELLYNYRLFRVIGPYARARGSLSLFPTVFTSDQDRDVKTVRGEIISDKGTIAAGGEVDLFPFAAPIIAQQSVGMSLTAVDLPFVSLGVRAGPAVRESFFRGGRSIAFVDDNELRLRELDDTVSFGAEGTAFGTLRLFRAVAYETVLETYVPSDQLTGFSTLEALQPAFRWDNNLSLRLSEFASLTYRATVYRLDPQIPEMSFFHGLGVRFQTNFF